MKKLEHEKLLDKRKQKKGKYLPVAANQDSVDLTQEEIDSEPGRAASVGDFDLNFNEQQEENNKLNRISHNLNKTQETQETIESHPNNAATTDYSASEFTETVLDRRELQEQNMDSIHKDDEEVEARVIEVNRPNVRTKQVLGCCSKRVQRFPNNKVTTARYNVFTFLPLNLMVQLSKLTNLYFLVLSIMELYKPISDSDGQPIILIPLSFIIAVSLVKDLFEDFARKAQDRAENNRYVLASSTKQPQSAARSSRRASGKGQSSFQEIEWKNIRVGNIVKVMENQYFPCDVLLVNSSLPKGICYVETKNLDGETNLKHKQAPKNKQLDKQVCDEAENDQEVQKNFQEAVIECEKENEFLYKFQGNLKMYENKEDLIPLSVDNMCMRGSSLRNTEWVYGIAIYTGHQTKVMMNSSRSAPKYSVIEKKTNQYLIFGIFLQTVLCLGCAAWYTILIWLYAKGQENQRDAAGGSQFGKGYQATYLLLDQQYTFTGTKPERDPSYTISSAAVLLLEFAKSFGTWFLAMQNFVSSSLLISQELTKFMQGKFINMDWMMYDETKDMTAKAQSSNLNDELGMVNYIFSDKTGTLTQNIMEFKKFSAGSETYGSSNPDKIEYEEGITNVNFSDSKFDEAWNDSNSDNYQNLVDFINILAICHTIIVEQKNGVLNYNASSPDELALTNAARHFGIVFEERDEENNVVIHNKRTNTREKYELLNLIEFTSARKRMTVIIKNEDGKILCMTKGADSHVLPRMAAGQKDKIELTNVFLEGYANEGLRTLILAQKEVDPEFYEQWNQKYTVASCSLKDREGEMDKVAELIEQDFLLIGSTAIEDKLQVQVEDTINFIRQAGVKLWVLTGDKIETAINIGFSCKLLDNDMEIFIIDAEGTNEIYKQIKDFHKKAQVIGLTRVKAVVVGGEQLERITKKGKDKIATEFLKLAKDSSVVLACRVSPKQKAEIVMLVRNDPNDKNIISLAIGDGANDVNMINAAHIGIGISGLEGQQAARAADYSIGQFRYLKNLMFVHGREAYRRNSYLVLYIFYKNVLFVLPLCFYGYWSQCSGVSLYDPIFTQVYNVVTTAFPILWFAVFDWQYTRQDLLSDPRYYNLGLKNYSFNSFQFLRTYFYATWQSLLIMILSFQAFSVSLQISDGTSIFDSMDLTGCFLVQTIVVLVNLKIMVQTTNHTFWSVSIQVLTILSFYAIFFVLSEFTFFGSKLLGFFPILLVYRIQWLLLIFFTICYMLIDTGLQKIDEYIFNKIEELEYEEDMSYQTFVESEKQHRQARKMTGYKHTGFGFDGDAGNDMLITEKIRMRLQTALANQLAAMNIANDFNVGYGGQHKANQAVNRDSSQSYHSLQSQRGVGQKDYQLLSTGHFDGMDGAEKKHIKTHKPQLNTVRKTDDESQLGQYASEAEAIAPTGALAGSLDKK